MIPITTNRKSHSAQQSQKVSTPRRESSQINRSTLVLFIWLCLVIQIIFTSFSDRQATDPSVSIRDTAVWPRGSLTGGVLFAEAGKKKKKEKSEVVVISVQNSPAKGAMYPIFVPSCGGHGSHGSYGRRKRSIIRA